MTISAHAVHFRPRLASNFPEVIRDHEWQNSTRRLPDADPPMEIMPCRERSSSEPYTSLFFVSAYPPGMRFACTKALF
jgi:hypothetical protein